MRVFEVRERDTRRRRSSRLAGGSSARVHRPPAWKRKAQAQEEEEREGGEGGGNTGAAAAVAAASPYQGRGDLENEREEAPPCLDESTVADPTFLPHSSMLFLCRRRRPSSSVAQVGQGSLDTTQGHASCV